MPGETSFRRSLSSSSSSHLCVGFTVFFLLCAEAKLTAGSDQSKDGWRTFDTQQGPAWPLLDWAALMFNAELATGTVFFWGREAATRCVSLSGIGRRTPTEISVNTSLTSLCWSFFSFLMYSLLLHPLGRWRHCRWMCSRFLPAVCLSNVACSISLRSSVRHHVCFLCRPVGLNRLMIAPSPRSCSATSDTC